MGHGKGSKRTAEQKARISAGLRRAITSGKWKPHRLASRKGSKMSAGAKARISVSLRVGYANGTRQVTMDAARTAAAEYWTGRTAGESQRRGLAVGWHSRKSEAHRAKIGASRERYFQEHPAEPPSEETKLKISKASKRVWASSSEKERHARVTPMLSSLRKGKFVSYIEEVVGQLLTELGVVFIRQASIGRYSADFLVPEKMLVIECDGEYWHRDKDRDARRDRYMQALGFTVLRLPGKTIKSGQAANILRLVV